MPPVLDSNLLNEARGWINDCLTGEEDFEDASELEDWEVVSIVKNNYDGGLSSFIANSQPSYPEVLR